MRPYPERARAKREHTAPEAGFLAFRSDAFVNALSQPHIGLHVPRIKQFLHIGGTFDCTGLDVGGVFPASLAVRPETAEA